MRAIQRVHAANDICSSDVEAECVLSLKLSKQVKAHDLLKKAASSSVSITSTSAASGVVSTRRTFLLRRLMKSLRAGKEDGSKVVFRIRFHFSSAGSSSFWAIKEEMLVSVSIEWRGSKSASLKALPASEKEQEVAV